MNEKELIALITSSIDQNVASEDRAAFADSIKVRLEGMIFLSDIDIEKKYGDLLHQLLDKVTEADETEGINPHLIAAGVGHAYLNR